MHSPFRHAGSIFWKRKPIHLTFFVTRKCNLECPYCFYLKSAEDGTRGVPDELSLDEIRQVSASLGRMLWIAFSGGEPYLRDDLAEIARVFYRQNAPAIMLLPTNGSLPDLIERRTEEILRECEEAVVVVKLSLDGIGSSHDALRRGRDSFEKTMETYGRLGRLLPRHPNFELGINTVFSAANEDRMDEIIDFVRGLDHVRTHTISMVRGDLADETYLRADSRKYERAVEKLAENMRRGKSPYYKFRGGRVKAAQDILQRRLIHRTAVKKRRIVPCYAGRLNIVLTETGDVSPCEILTESLGNVRDYGYDVRRVLRSERAGKAVRAIREGRCACTHECNFITNILFNPRLYPALLGEYVRLGGGSRADLHSCRGAAEQPVLRP